jgi:hypothetical protein
MALLKQKQIESMSEKEREEKIKELSFELIKGSVQANKTNAKTKELKRALARLYNYEKHIKFNKPAKEKLKRKS